MLLGCIADDLTGATDLALMLARNGLRTVQTIGVPAGKAPDAEAVVVALKSRTIPAADAVAQSLDALRWVRAAGARQVFFKYCSTFDSTPAGNIGPVADALLDALGAHFTIACPAFPANHRSVYQGHLFVGAVLLSDSGMRNHPLTPMTDPNLVSVLARQTNHKVGLVAFPEVDAGTEALRAAFARLRKEGVRHAIVDAVSDRHLMTIGTAVSDLALVTGGSGVAMGLPENFRRAGLAPARNAIVPLPAAVGHAAVLAGSCSPATLGQIEAMRASAPAFEIDVLALAEGGDVAGDALAWAKPKLGRAPLLIYASQPADKVASIQSRLGRAESGEMVEHAMAKIATGLVEAGVGRLVVAGGETAGAVVGALGVRTLQIGPEIDPGVPWTAALDGPKLSLALKSGNFGGRDFFTKAFQVLG
ncbi:MAG: four-carbon acid sugar kinase family protein [Alphaproteobacteria bacterium]|nr:four-carbon acid sugar kinase family protein [Alphaproteobacteria bacterium]